MSDCVALAKHLIDIGAVNFNIETPFTYTSGKTGPVYVQMSRLISYPRARNEILNSLVEMLHIVLPEMDCLAGGETAGIPYAAFLAEKTNKPMVYVRKQPKGFGKKSQIEGHIDPYNNILMVEDLSNFGGSSLKFVDVLRDNGKQVDHLVTVFDYGRAETAQAMQDANITHHKLLNWGHVLAAAEKYKLFDQKTIDGVRDYLYSEAQ